VHSWELGSWEPTGQAEPQFSGNRLLFKGLHKDCGVGLLGTAEGRAALGFLPQVPTPSALQPQISPTGAKAAEPQPENVQDTEAATMEPASTFRCVTLGKAHKLSEF
jgi:hypothetical protein